MHMSVLQKQPLCFSKNRKTEHLFLQNRERKNFPRDAGCGTVHVWVKINFWKFLGRYAQYSMQRGWVLTHGFCKNSEFGTFPGPKFFPPDYCKGKVREKLKNSLTPAQPWSGVNSYYVVEKGLLVCACGISAGLSEGTCNQSLGLRQFIVVVYGGQCGTSTGKFVMATV